jgi:hypothetical protein
MTARRNDDIGSSKREVGRPARIALPPSRCGGQVGGQVKPRYTIT